MRRFDARAVYAALDEQRRSRGLTWRQTALEIGGVSVPMLTRLAKSGRLGVRAVVTMAAWLGRPVESFTHAADW